MAASKDPWTQYTSTQSANLTKTMSLNPAAISAEQCLSAAHSSKPFSEATTILDDGCGPGTLTSLLFDKHDDQLPQDAQVLATDFSPSIIDRVRLLKSEKLAAGDKRWENVQAEVMSACDLPAIPSNSISHVVAGFVFFLVPDPAAALREAFRVLASGGILALTSWTCNDWQSLVSTVCAEVAPDEVEKLVNGTLPPSWRGVDVVVPQLSATGFVDVKGEPFECGMSYESAEKLIRFLVGVVPNFREMVEVTAAKMSGEMEEGKDVLVRRCVERLTEWRGESGIMEGKAFWVVGRKA